MGERTSEFLKELMSLLVWNGSAVSVKSCKDVHNIIVRGIWTLRKPTFLIIKKQCKVNEYPYY